MKTIEELKQEKINLQNRIMTIDVEINSIIQEEKKKLWTKVVEAIIDYADYCNDEDSIHVSYGWTVAIDYLDTNTPGFIALND